jgi:tetratricopeptide (TPR) repeat protein
VVFIVTGVSSRRLRRLVIFGIPLCLLIPGFLFLFRSANSHEIPEEIHQAIAHLDLDRAARLLDVRLERFPDDPKTLFLAARCARRQNQLSDAERFLERCQHAGGITESTKLEWDLLQVQRGNVAGIDTRLRQSIPASHPDVIYVLESLAWGYLLLERLRDAREACELWISIDPQAARPRQIRARIYERIGETTKAKADYLDAIQLATDDRHSRQDLATLSLKDDEIDEAARQFRWLFERFPDAPEVRVGLATCLFQNGDSDEAERLLEPVLQKEPNRADAIVLRGRIALAAGRLDAAESALARGVELKPDDREILYHYLRVLQQRNRREEALSARLKLDRLEADLKRLDDLVRATANRPLDGNLRAEAARLCMRIGRYDEAIRWWKSASNLKTADVRAIARELAECYSRLGNRTMADHYRQMSNP